MKNYEVGIIIAVIVVIGFYWYKNTNTPAAPVQQPIGSAVPISFVGPACELP